MGRGFFPAHFTNERKGMIALKKFFHYIFSTLLGVAIIGIGGFVLGHSLEGAINLIYPPKETEPAAAATTTTVPETEPESPRKIVGYTPDDEPIYEDQIFIPEPFYYDEYGARYLLVDGTIDEYYLDEDYWEEIETLDSAAFIMIRYNFFYTELNVKFRDSGAWYIYYDVEPEVWDRFKHADSKGSFFNESIKGYYEYERY